MTMSGTHTEAVLNKLTKPELVQLLLKTEATLGSQISDLSKEIKDTLTHLKKLEADIAVLKIVNDRLVERIVKTERQCWENVQYSRRDTLEIVGIAGILTIVSLRKQCVVSLERLVSKLMNGISKPVIA